MTDARTSRTYAILGLIGGALGALIALVHGALWGFTEITVAATQSALWTPVEALRVFMGAIAVLGLVGIHERQAAESGTLGLVGFVIAFIGLATATGLSFLNAFVAPVFADVAPQDVSTFPATLMTGNLLIILIAALGLVLLGIAVFRAGVLPKWAGGLMVVAGLLAFNPVTGPVVAPFLGSTSIAWLCWTLWSEGGTAGAEPTAGATA